MKDRTWLGIIAVAVLVLVALVYGAGTAQSQVNPDKNHPEYWGETCVKIDEYQGGNEWTSPTDYALVVLKSGTENYVYENVEKGTVLTLEKDISHIIVCEPVLSIPTTTTPPQKVTTTVPTSTSTTVKETTTSTSAPSTTTTVETSSTSMVSSTTTSAPPPSTSTEPPDELPFTGPANLALVALGASGLIALGVATLRKVAE